MKRKNKPELGVDDAIHVQNVVECEGGMDYAFRYYSDFPEIKDKKFHSLRKAYCKAAQELSDYCRIEEELCCTECGASLEDGVCPSCPAEEVDEAEVEE